MCSRDCSNAVETRAAGRLWGGDRVADRDVVVADQDFADEEADDLLALLDAEFFGAGRQAGVEALERR